ncbi:MAG: hypothetical protein G01um101431_776 [Parcubacteria group bacterium Gr01-1014_31]|nr:MAG: hypothetical protein G01um101431_776 [Parcubacteria group bacterium Gr01-1014_31]
MEQPVCQQFTIAGHTYGLMSFHEEGEGLVNGDTMVERALKRDANLGEEDGALILEHQDEIPQKFRGEFYLVFAAWHHPSRPQRVACLRWNGFRWCQDWYWLGSSWGGYDRLVRKVSMK